MNFINKDKLNTKNILYKKKEEPIYIDYNEFDNYKIIFDRLSKVLRKNIRYSIITRISYINRDYGSYTVWKMLGQQIYIKYECSESLNNSILNYHNTIREIILNSLDMYNFTESEVLGIQIIAYRLDYSDIIKKISLGQDAFGLHKDIVNVSNTTRGLNKIVPLKYTNNDLGVVLNKNIKDNNINYITLLDGSNVNFIERINKYTDKKIITLDVNAEFYQKTVRHMDVIIIVQRINEEQNKIQVYNINGMKLYDIFDKKINKNIFSREVGNVKVLVDQSGIYNKKIKIKFKPIYPHKSRGLQSKMITHPDYMIGTLDLETYNVENNISKVYALGFYANNECHTFYIDSDLNSDNLIMKCLDKMLVEKYHNYTFYVHNLGKFDAPFILYVLIKNSESNSNKYKYRLGFRDSDILYIDISTKVNNKTYTIKLVDSLNILQSSLSVLCKTFNTDVSKSFFPYNFVNKNNLYYIGNKPDIKYYDNIDINTYKKIPEINWSLKKETLSYLELDLISLYKVVDKFKDRIWINYHTHITNTLTISGLAMNIFLKKFYNNNIPLITDKSVFNNIKESYYGGMTEVYKPYGKNLYYYDVNSLYPYGALNDMPGLECSYVYSIHKNINEIKEDLFGFFYCKIETPKNDYLGLLPVRNKIGVTMPLGIFEGWYFSEEVKFAAKQGYNIEIIHGYNFDRTKNVFDKYIEEFYKIKLLSTDNIERSIAKSLLNNLLGRFGLTIDKQVTKLVSKQEFNDILQTKKIISIKYINDSDKILVTYNNEITIDTCYSHDVDFANVFKHSMLIKDKTLNNRMHDVSVAISSAVTSYSRIFMNKIKLGILNKGGSIYYTDTDSIVTNIKLSNSIIGLDIGKFKLEHEIKEAYFISNKTYCFTTNKGEFIKKCKGLSNKALVLNDYINLFNGIDVDTIRHITIRDYSQGSVTIKVPQKMILSANAYTKRTKVLHNNLWVDTKPLYIKSSKYHTLKTKSRERVFRFKDSTIVFLYLLVMILILFIYSTIFVYVITSESNLTMLNSYPEILDIEKVYTINTSDKSSILKTECNKFFNFFINDKKSMSMCNIEDSTNINYVNNKSQTNFKDKSFTLKTLDSDTSIVNNINIQCKLAIFEIEEFKNKVSRLELELMNLKSNILYTNSVLDSIIKDLS